MLPPRWSTSGNGSIGSPTRLRELRLPRVSPHTDLLARYNHAKMVILFSYHQDVKDWYFGKLSALREISLALEGDYQFYYMGKYSVLVFACTEFLLRML